MFGCSGNRTSLESSFRNIPLILSRIEVQFYKDNFKVFDAQAGRLFEIIINFYFVYRFSGNYLP